MSKKGFTLIELMIVVAIIAIIAAIAIPNLLQSRLRANEATAVTCVRNYGTAQVTFQVGQQAAVSTNTKPENSGSRGYCDTFRNLFYGNPKSTTKGGGLYDADTSRNLSLISQAHADAYISGYSPLTDVVTKPTPETTTPVVYQGYHFNEDPAQTSAPIGAFSGNYSMIAVPAHSASTGNRAFWMDAENTVLSYGLPANLKTPKESLDYVTGKGTPWTATNRQNWSSL